MGNRSASWSTQKTSGDQLIAAYPELHARAVLAAKELGVELP